MKLRAKPQVISAFGLLLLLCTSAANSFCLDREAFSITRYDLSLELDPTQHRLGVRGKITLRNDTSSPQKIVVLQISSSLDWRSIKADDIAVQFVTQPFASDIDHTGALSEAIVTLPQAVAPKGSVELEIAYEGIVVRDATRLTRIGMPEDQANSTDWDQISENFTALRGAGYVAWYPILTDVANISEGSVPEVLTRWKLREAGSKMQLKVRWRGDPDQVFLNGTPGSSVEREATSAVNQYGVADFDGQPLHRDAPTLIIADYQVLEKPSAEVRYLKGHDVAATKFADAAERAAPLVAEWFGKPRERAKIADLPDPEAAPFESGNLLLTPLASADVTLDGLAASHQITHATVMSSRAWIQEGLAHFAQALFLEQKQGRAAALDYMALHRSTFLQNEQSAAKSEDADRSLVNTTTEELYRSKAMCVWWMLRDMVGDAALKKAIAAYRPGDDNDPSYMPKLIAAQAQRDLGWFFDDWVYHDHGLPDFKMEPAFSQKSVSGAYLVTVTVENLGTAGAEVPIIVKTAASDVTQRLEVRAKSKASIRITAPDRPLQVVVNDGSVPERDGTNNIFKMPEPTQ